MARIAVDRIHVKNRWNRREDRPLQPRRRLAVRAQGRLHIHGSDSVVVVKLDVVLSVQTTFTGRPTLLDKTAASAT